MEQLYHWGHRFFKRCHHRHGHEKCLSLLVQCDALTGSVRLLLTLHGMLTQLCTNSYLCGCKLHLLYGLPLALALAQALAYGTTAAVSRFSLIIGDEFAALINIEINGFKHLHLSLTIFSRGWLNGIALFKIWNSEIKMPSSWHASRIDTVELKAQIVRKIGHQKAEKYFNHLKRLFSLKLSKSAFNKLCISTIGRENVSLHNQLIGSIIKNACLAKTPPLKESKVEGSPNVKIANGYQRSSLQSFCEDAFPPSPRKGRSPSIRDRKFKDRPRPLGPHGEIQSVVCEESVPRTQEQQSATELLSLSSRPPGEVVSVEDGEEVEQVSGSPCVQSRSPVRAPLGIIMNMGGSRKAFCNGSVSAFHPNTCHNSSELPDTRSLKKWLERKLEMEGLSISMDCVNLLNNGLDTFLKRLIKPCMQLVGSRYGHDEHLKQVNDQVIPGSNGMLPGRYMQRSTRSISATMLDFRIAMELNPRILGADWPVQLEKVCLHASEELIEP
ncbi:hypothetical protein HHK36_008306 [Tetracentron sinense]|uniref:Transcriptional coactivator Hfi1/Transcriptional adapter 1 n=1 Tax=Tetracentron sinense TaxID=13715 RepID=A0A834ZM87_TETSI|nr:hypothetical protein HHK36_008306 [Tetracentron sinense]